MIKFSICAFVGMVVCSSFTYADNSVHKQTVTNQDSLWTLIKEDISLDSKLYHNKGALDSQEYAFLHEAYLQKIRNRGLVFWNSYPNDKRRFKWLSLTIDNSPNYYNYLTKEFDIMDREQWNKIYPSLRREYFSSFRKFFPQDVNGLYCFEVIELSSKISSEKFISNTLNTSFNLRAYVNPIISLAKRADSELLLTYLLSKTGDLIFENISALKLDINEVFNFLTSLKTESVPNLSAWADGKLRMVELRQQPLELSFYSFDNKLIDISRMKGKIILIDFWATWCSVCLDYMPTIKKLYSKYKAKGFEVVSISINRKSEEPQVLSTEKRIGASWPLGIIGDDKLRNEIWLKFGFTSVPQLILLDRSGKLIENNGKLMDEKTLDELVKNALE